MTASLPITAEAVSPEVVERMVALVRDMASNRSDIAWQPWVAWRNTAQTLAALLPKPVDPDEAEALAIVKSLYPEMRDTYSGRRVTVALAALKRGRELAASEASK